MAELPTIPLAQSLRRRGFFRPSGRIRLRRNKGDVAEMATPLNRCDTVRLRSARTKNTSGQIAESPRPKRRRNPFVVVALLSARVLNHAEQRTAATLPTLPGRSIRPRFFDIIVISPPWRSIPAGAKPRRLFLNGTVPQSYRHHWSAFRLDDKVPPSG